MFGDFFEFYMYMYTCIIFKVGRLYTYVGMVPTHPLALTKVTAQNCMFQALSDQQPALRVLLYTIIFSKYIKYTGTVILRKL